MLCTDSAQKPIYNEWVLTFVKYLYYMKDMTMKTEPAEKSRRAKEKELAHIIQICQLK